MFALFPTGRTTSEATSTLLADLSHADREMPRVSFDFPCHVRWVIKRRESRAEKRAGERINLNDYDDASNINK